MKAFLTTMLAVLCTVVLIWGNFHWNKQITISSGQTIERIPNIKAKSKEEMDDKEKSKDLIDFTKNWPLESSTAFKKAIEEEKQYKILLVGSSALGENKSGWSDSFRTGLLSTYGDLNLSVEIKEYTETTMDFINNSRQEEIVESNADMILFEPFILTDNGSVKIEDSLQFIKQIMDDVKDEKPETVFVLQPPNPIYSPKYYATQVNELKTFTEENDIPYLDHWSAWPDPSNEDIKNYLEEESKLPNELGHKVWSDFLLNYFISK